MSWDICLSRKNLYISLIPFLIDFIDTNIEVGNYTYNVNPMYARAMNVKGLTEALDGKKCKNVMPILQEGIASMKDDPETYEAMNPPNGWGDYKGASEFLEKI
ncbi:unnamed protein product, partial [marine sediment metagenome]